MLTIVLDPGHGGARADGRPGIDPGVIVEGVKESAVAVAYTAELTRALLRAGHQVVTTRTGDNVALTLSDRAGIANRCPGRVVFASLHCNAAPGAAAHGFQVFHCRGSDAGQRLGETITAAVVPAVAPRTDRVGVFPDQSIHCGYTQAANEYVASLREDRRLDWKAADGKVRERFGPHRGYRSLAVLRQTTMPAVLIELDFVTNPSARARLLDDGYRRSVCAAIASGFTTWAS
ncbi:N-acetylmuramoyl-L-alanine amidase [Longimicrobium sp.]|jgi:N-acetylmuramoyl-L-alanine amidase|uniref:N-acetylmuramoyl-L-alanine amidase n=1 Tax=Longimicrobium sp. TaxID=2029185 RepID=UPI002ED9693D